MRTFKDTAGRTWTVCVNCDALKRLRTDLKINLIGDDCEKGLAPLLGDPPAAQVPGHEGDPLGAWRGRCGRRRLAARWRTRRRRKATRL